MDGKQEGGCCDNDVHEIFKCLGEIALTSAYVVENADGTTETWNCAASSDRHGTVEVMPSEPVVERVHANLKSARSVRVRLATGVVAADCPASMTWLPR